MKKRWTIGTAVCVLMLTPLSYAAAETEGTIESKDEVIYANLFAEGGIEELYIVNALTVSEDGAISDFGHYDSITNLTDLSTIEQEDDEVKLEASTGTFHYQGNIQDNPELPWHFDIRYILDGDVVEPEDVIGQDGSFELEIDVTQNEDGNERFFENYLLQVSVPLNSETFKEVDAPDATVANAGKNKQLAFTVMPEEEAELRISAEATDIELDGIEISALPSSFAVEMPDTDELTGEFDSLTGAIGDLANGVGELKTGIDGLSGGLTELGTGSAQFQTGLGELSANGDELVTASSQIQTGLIELNNALSQSNLNTDMDLSMGSDLTDGLNQLVAGLDELSGGLTELGTHHEQGYLALEEAINAIPEATLSEEDIGNLYATTEDTDSLDALVSSYTAAQTVKGTFEGVKEAFTSVKPALNDMSTSTSEMGNGLSELSNSLSSLEDSFDFDSGLDELTTGIAELANQYGQFHEGLNSYTSGVSTVTSEYNHIQNGIEKSAAGSSELANGGATLHSGINELHEATAEIPDQMQQEIDEMISQYDKSDFDPVSFVHESNDDLVENVQFVIQTEPLTKDEPAQEIEEEEELSIWQRFLNLFRS